MQTLKLAAAVAPSLAPAREAERPSPGLLKQLGTMTACRDMHLVEHSLLRTLGPLLGVDRTSLYRVDASHEVVRVLHHTRSTATVGGELHRVSEAIEELSNSIPLDMVERALLGNLRLLDRPCTRQRGPVYLIGYPLHGADHLCGYFVFERDHPATPTEDAVVHGVLEVFSNYYALLDTSQRDRLTGLLNRYSLEINLNRIWELLAARVRDVDETRAENRRHASETYWLGVLDIDHFKRVNDTYGHIIGDEILLLTSRLLESAFRRADLLYRYGGEEFVAIVAADDLPAATMAFERARRTVEEFVFPQVGKLTISCGFSVADPTVLPQTIINRADRALYEAKADGRNQVHHYEDLVSLGRLGEVPAGTVDLF
ncbi:MAG: GGDEF domain-containing protein [Pseudomonadota bacterium]